MQDCRLIIEGTSLSPSFWNDGAYNMAVDEMLLRTASEEGCSTLRFYGWRPATLSLGYFQKIADRKLHDTSLNCDVVRRASGGGAILHDRELTYCFAMPAKSRFGGAEELYLAFHETLVAVLAEHHVEAHLQTANEGLTDQAFLCFQRRASGDVTCARHKIAGSAQRRWKNAVVQHGSVLLAQSAYAPELPGLKELGGFETEIQLFIQEWIRKLGSRLKTAFNPGDLADREVDGAIAVRRDKFAHPSWIGRR
jgi:lipoate-protein ligase A